MAEAQVSSLLHLAGDDGIGLADEGIDQFLRTRHADFAVQFGVTLVQIGGQEIQFMEVDHVLEGEVTEHVVRDVEGIRYTGAVVDGVLEIPGIRNELLGCFRVREQGAVHGLIVPLDSLLVFVQGFVGTGDEDVVLTAGDVCIVFLAGVQVHVQVRLQGLQAGGEAVHGHDAARRGAGDGADVLAAFLEHFRVAVVHPFGELRMFADAAGSQATVHAVMQLVEEGSLFHQGVTGRSEEMLLIGLGEEVADQFVLGTTPVRTGTVTSVMADVEGLVPLRGGRVLDGLEFVGMRVERGAADVAFEVLHHRGVRLRGGRQGEERHRGQGQDSFHNFIGYNNQSSVQWPGSRRGRILRIR